MDNTTDFSLCKRFGISPEQLAAAVQTSNVPHAADSVASLSDNERLTRLPAVSQADRLGLNDPAPSERRAARSPLANRKASVKQGKAAPRSSNTGAQSAEEAQSALVAVPANSDQPTLLEPGFLIDWLRFVVVSETEQQRVLASWRPEAADWSELESGHMGYRRCYRADGIAIYYDHAEEGRGICVDVSGKGCRALEARALREPGVLRSLGWSGLLHKLTSTVGVHITRLDVALDDKAGLVDLDKVNDAINSGLVVSRFKSAYCIEKKSLSSGEGFGKTVNFGSRVSDLMIRMYNKAAEQKQESKGHWTRVELEAKDENAVALAKALAASSSGEEGAVVAGVLRNYLTFRERGKNAQKTRWPISGWWLSFLQFAGKLKLATAKQEPLLVRMRAWLDRQVVPTLAVLYNYANIVDPGVGGKRLLADLVMEGERRQRPKHQKALMSELSRLSLAAPVGGPTGF